MRPCTLQSPYRARAGALIVALACLGTLPAGCGSGADTTPADATTDLGSGTASGSVEGRTFDQIAAAYRIGQPDDPDQTTVLYLFDAEIPCADVSLCKDSACTDLAPSRPACTEVTATATAGPGIRCPCHGSTFSLEDGAALTGPASRPLPSYQVSLDGDDLLVDTGAWVDPSTRV